MVHTACCYDYIIWMDYKEKQGYNSDVRISEKGYK